MLVHIYGAQCNIQAHIHNIIINIDTRLCMSLFKFIACQFLSSSSLNKDRILNYICPLSCKTGTCYCYYPAPYFASCHPSQPQVITILVQIFKILQRKCRICFSISYVIKHCNSQFYTFFCKCQDFILIMVEQYSIVHVDIYITLSLSTHTLMNT